MSSFLCFFKLLGYQPPNDVASRLFSLVLDCHLELTFQYDRICRLKALPHRVRKVFWQEWDMKPRTRSCSRSLDWGISRVWRLRPLGHPAWFTSTYFLLICVFSIEWRFQFRDVICQMVCAIYLERFEFKPARRVVFYMSPPSILFFCALSNCSAINHPMTLRVVCFLLLWTVILNWPSSMTEFVGWRLCLIVFKTFSDRSGIRTHAHNRVPEFSTEEFLESGALDRSAILPGLPRHFSVWSVLFQKGKFFNSEI